MRHLLLAVCICAVFSGARAGAWDPERDESRKGQQRGIDIGRRAARAVSRGGAGRPSVHVEGRSILAQFREGIESGMWYAPHDAFEEFTDDSNSIGALFGNHAGTDALVSVLALLATISAAASGIGGGGLLVPIYLLIMGWSISNAVPLSNATIFGNAITNIIINFPLRHPTADRPLVDFDLALVLIPMELTGSLVGVLLNIMFPQYLTLACLLFLLVFTTYRTYNKGAAQWEKENAQRKKDKRVKAAAEANVGDHKKVTLEDQTGQHIEMQVIKGDDDNHTIQQVTTAMSVKENSVLQFTDEHGEKIKKLAFDFVDDAGVYFVSVRDPPARKENIDVGFRELFKEHEPTKDDLAKLIVLDTTEVRRKYIGASQPYESWDTEQVISWFQAITDDCEALCFNIEKNMISGTDLLLFASDTNLAHQELLHLGVAVETDRELILNHLKSVSDQDYMLLVYTREEVPWGAWNRGPEWTADADNEEVDLDGWMEDDPCHPKNEPETYLSSQSFVSVHTWDNPTVLKWVDKISDYNYTLKHMLKKNDIDGRTLLALRAEDLVSLGIPQLGPRLSFLERVNELKELYADHEDIVLSEKDIPYTTNLAVLFGSWLLLLVLAILKGGGKKGGQSPVAQWEGKTQEEFCGTASFWILWWVGVPLLILITYVAGNYLLNKHRRKIKTHFKFHEGDIKWNAKRVRVFPAIVIIAGILAGLLGVGGAMVTGPLMLEMNMIPRVSTATSSFLIIFTTGVAAIAYISLGTLKIDYALWFATIGGVGAAVGLNIINMLLKKYNRQSMVIWSLTLVFILAIVGTVVAGTFRVMDAIEQGKLGFNPVCG
eukprot:TRINITY_DN2864_c0_g1_i1.p1 TRINITY_DN2864_c0_g1~~TRINITY_DN2864_c0_g1_i1.p1  ORF type:complete len:831 (+),score=212.54 TRINITY_DN2864_c0_g1_i1:55-2547(+)